MKITLTVKFLYNVHPLDLLKLSDGAKGDIIGALGIGKLNLDNNSH